MTTTAKLGTSVTGRTVCPPFNSFSSIQVKLPDHDHDRSADFESESDSSWCPDSDLSSGAAVAFIVTVPSQRSVIGGPGPALPSASVPSSLLRLAWAPSVSVTTGRLEGQPCDPAARPCLRHGGGHCAAQCHSPHGSGPELIQVHLCLSNSFRVCEAKSESISPARMCARARARGDDVILGGQRDVTGPFSTTCESAVLTPATDPELDL